MSNLNEEDIAEHKKKIVPYVFVHGTWLKYDKREKKYNPCEITTVPSRYLLNYYDKLIIELSNKEEWLIEIKKDYSDKEFHYRFISDFDFKKEYGKANDDVRKHHAEIKCKELLDTKKSLEISINYIKRYMRLIEKVVEIRRIG